MNTTGDRKRKIFVPVPERTDDYCTVCDDGGLLIFCTICEKAFCYDCDENNENNENDEPEVTDLSLQNSGATTDRACISLPRGYLDDRHRVFRCPICLSNHPERAIDYTINRGARATQRVAVSAHLVIIISCLPQLASRGRDIYGAIESLLGAFEVMVTCLYLQTPYLLSKQDIQDILKSDGPYHLVFTFFTESNPLGGWWFADNIQERESTWLKKILDLYDDIARKAISARIFGICCGINLPGPDAVTDIVEGFEGFQWSSIILPAAPSVSPEEYATMLPELFMQLYYNGLPLKSSLLRIWATSKRARVHTDLFVVDRPEFGAKITVQKYSYAANNRPWSIDLPVGRSFCACTSKEEESQWRQLPLASKLRFGEHFACYRSKCGHADLQIAVYVEGFELRSVRGTQVLLQDYDFDLLCFPFDTHDRFCMKVSVVADDKKKERRRGAEHDSPWTAAGKKALSCKARP